MIGNPGRGKTHISIAIGLKACLQGYRVLFKNAGTLATELTEARDAYQLGRIERQLEKTDLLILDELSYMSFNKYESELAKYRDKRNLLLRLRHLEQPTLPFVIGLLTDAIFPAPGFDILTAAPALRNPTSPQGQFILTIERL